MQILLFWILPLWGNHSISEKFAAQDKTLLRLFGDIENFRRGLFLPAVTNMQENKAA